MSRGEEKAKRWRPWQFSLRFLMLLTVVVAAFFGGWVANDWNREQQLNREKADLTKKALELIKRGLPHKGKPG